MTETRLIIGTPTREGALRVDYVRGLLDALSGLNQMGITARVLFYSGSSIVSYARNAITASVWRSDATHLLFVDDDIGGWTALDIERMLKSGKDLICGAYTVRQGDRICVSNPREVPGEPAHIIEADAVGGGFMLISRHCLEIVAGVSAAAVDHTIGRIWFEHLILADRFQGEDFSFCAKFRGAGGRVFVDREVRLSHHVSTVWPSPSGNLPPLSPLPAA